MWLALCFICFDFGQLTYYLISILGEYVTIKFGLLCELGEVKNRYEGSGSN